MLKSLRRKVRGDLRTNWGQFLAVWLVVMLGTTTYGAMYPASVNMVDSLFNTYDQLRYMDFQVQVAQATPEQIEATRTIPSVANVTPRLVVEGGIQVDPDHAYLISLRLISVPDDAQAEVNRNYIVAGNTIQANGELLLLHSFAKYHGYQPGDTVQVQISGKQHSFRVAGLAFNPEYLVAGRGSMSPWPTLSTFGVAWIRHSELAELSGQTGIFNEVVVRLTGSSEDERSAIEPAVRAELVEIFATQDVTPIVFSKSQTSSGAVIEANLKGSTPVMIFFSGLFLAGGTVVTGILMTRIVSSERQRIGTLRAMGVTRSELVTHYLTFGFLIGLTGGLVGSVLGYLNSFWFMYTFLDYIAGGTLPGFVNTPQVPFILLGLLIVTAGSTIAGAYPAWTHSGTPPGIALRPFTPKTPHVMSRLSLKSLPLFARQTVRNLLRAPGRVIGTALGTTAGAMMLFAALTMYETLDTNFGRFYDIPRYDLRVDMGTLQPSEILEAQVGALDGVTDVQAGLLGPVTITRPNGQPFETLAIAVEDANRSFDFVTVTGVDIFSTADGVWLGHNAQRVLDVEIGESITLNAFDQTHTVKVLGVISQTVGSPIYIPRTLLTQWTPGGLFPTNTAFVHVKPGYIAAVRDTLAALPGVQAVEIVDDFNRDVDRYISYYRMNTVLFGSFGVILTLALLFNTVNASLRERREELAILRALGSNRLEIALSVTLELITMAAFGMVVGIPLGHASGVRLNTAYELEFFGQTNVLSAPTIALGIAGLLVVVVLSEIPGLRAVQRSDLGQISKSQSF